MSQQGRTSILTDRQHSGLWRTHPLPLLYLAIFSTHCKLFNWMIFNCKVTRIFWYHCLGFLVESTYVSKPAKVIMFSSAI